MAQPENGEPGSEAAPRWVKISVVVALIVFVLFLILLLSGGHGPRRHLPGDGHAPPVEHGP